MWLNQALVSLLLCGIAFHGLAADESKSNPIESKARTMTPKELLQAMQGKWTGNCRTWFEPDKLADESTVSGEFTPVFDGRLLRHTYTGSMKGKPRQGDDLIAFNPTEERFESSWIDSFHMNYGILFSTGEATASGFSVRGDYGVGKEHPKWGWRTEFTLIDNDHLTITAYNIMPGAEEAKAVETVYERVKSPNP